MGLFPKGVEEFNVAEDGKFWVHLDQACNAKFENELHYDRNVSGTLSKGKIDGLTGLEAQDLFLWFPVLSIRVDVPSSGLIYFDVGAAFKQFSLSLFESPPDCVAVRSDDVSTDVDDVSKVCLFFKKLAVIGSLNICLFFILFVYLVLLCVVLLRRNWKKG